MALTFWLVTRRSCVGAGDEDRRKRRPLEDTELCRPATRVLRIPSSAEPDSLHALSGHASPTPEVVEYGVGALLSLVHRTTMPGCVRCWLVAADLDAQQQNILPLMHQIRHCVERGPLLRRWSGSVRMEHDRGFSDDAVRVTADTNAPFPSSGTAPGSRAGIGDRLGCRCLPAARGRIAVTTAPAERRSRLDDASARGLGGRRPRAADAEPGRQERSPNQLLHVVHSPGSTC